MKKNMCRAGSGFVVAFFLLSAVLIAEEQTDVASGLTYTVAEGEATVTGINALPADGHVSIPGTLGGLPVVAIADHAFEYSAITKLTAPSVEQAGFAAFFLCQSLSEVSLPEADTIGDSAFFNCTELGEISLPEATTVGGSVFKSCTSLKSASLPKVTSLGTYAFNYCTMLETVDLSALKSVGEYSFYNCNKLENLSLPEATSIGFAAFEICKALKSLSLPKVSKIENVAFKDCTGLSDRLHLPEAAEIGAGAFEGCHSVTSLSLPKATKIGTDAFKGCSSMETLSLLGVEEIRGSAFENCSGLQSLSLPEAVAVGVEAFKNCRSLQSVSLPRADAIRSGTFAGCTSLQTVSAPGAGSVGSSAFSGCTALHSVDLPAAKSIGDGAFYNCDALESMSLFAVGSIGKEAFAYSENLKELHLGRAPTLGEDAFVETHPDLAIHHRPRDRDHFAQGDWAGLNKVEESYPVPGLADAWRGFRPAHAYPYTRVNLNYATGNEHPSTIHFADFNRDGHTDFLLDGFIYAQSRTGNFTDRYHIYLNQGDGTFGDALEFSKGAVTRNVSDVGDYNRDGHPDLLISDFWYNGFRIHTGKAGPAFDLAASHKTGTHGGPTQFHDLDKDGDLDIVSISAGSAVALKVHVFRNDGGVFSKAATLQASAEHRIDFYANLKIADVNNDGKPDMFAFGENGISWILLQNSITSFTLHAYGLFGGYFGNVFYFWNDVVDYNGDGLLDSVCIQSNDYPSAVSRMFVRLQTAAGKYEGDPDYTVQLPGQGARVFFEDMNADGELDLVLRSFPGVIRDGNFISLTGPQSISVHLRKGTNDYESATRIDYAQRVIHDEQNFRSLGFEDLNKDGLTDMVLIREDAKVEVHLNSGIQPDSYSDWLDKFPSLQGDDLANAADPDGDGLANALEYAMDTPPDDADNGGIAPEDLAFGLAPSAADGRHQLSWRQRSGGVGCPGADYGWKDSTLYIEATTDLADANSWEALPDDSFSILGHASEGDAGRVSIQLEDPWPERPKGFFRLRAEIDEPEEE